MTYPHGGADEIWRDGVGAAHNPRKAEIRAWGREIETAVGAPLVRYNALKDALESTRAATDVGTLWNIAGAAYEECAPGAADFEFLTAGGVKLRPQNGTIRNVALPPRPAKATAVSLAEAVAMSRDLTAMGGYAALAGVTGGNAYADYTVTNSGDDPENPQPGSLRWAIEQAREAGGGVINIHPDYRQFEFHLRGPIYVPANITIAAMGRNARFFAPHDFNFLRLEKENIILRCLSIKGVAAEGAGSGDLPPGAESGGDLLRVDAAQAGRTWVSECTIAGAPGDGMCDIVTLGRPVIKRRTSFDRCLFLGPSPRGILIGSLYCSENDDAAYCEAALTTTPQIEVDFQNCAFVGVGERAPKVTLLGRADMIGCVNILQDQDDRATGNVCSAYGAKSYTGGQLYANGCIGMSWRGAGRIAYGAHLPQGSVAWGTVAANGEGAARVVGSYIKAGVTIAERNAGNVADPVYPFAGPLITDTPAGHQARIEEVLGTAGAERISPLAGQFMFVDGETSIADGVRAHGIGAAGGGLWVRFGYEARTERAPAPPAGRVELRLSADEVATVTPPALAGTLFLFRNYKTSPDHTRSGGVYYDVGTSPTGLELTNGTGSKFDVVSDIDLNATPGADGNVTLSIRSGAIQIENRSGGASDFLIIFGAV
ncbi:MAG: hypothetical protein CSA68_07490 [Rhodobacterales bacterium]|nr:MAG: hypothetical protein CSA68_07490 [Rhodobacterales bacterium]